VSETPKAYGNELRARLTRQGHITVPRAVRDGLEAMPGDDIVFELRGPEVVLHRRARVRVSDLAGIAADTAPPGGLTKEQLTDAVESAVGEAYVERLRRPIEDPPGTASR
jgi:bifunctional DNA-binding transcriptional regulator/antitoxin component of YhaV-PrlF toxin-antitoxin module